MRSRRTSCKIDAMTRQRGGLHNLLVVGDPVAKTNEVGCATCLLRIGTPQAHEWLLVGSMILVIIFKASDSSSSSS